MPALHYEQFGFLSVFCFARPVECNLLRNNAYSVVCRLGESNRLRGVLYVTTQCIRLHCSMESLFPAAKYHLPSRRTHRAAFS